MASHSSHRSLDRSLPKSLLLAIRPMMKHLVHSFDTHTNFQDKITSITIKFDTTTWKTAKKHSSTPTRSAEHQPDLDPSIAHVPNVPSVQISRSVAVAETTKETVHSPPTATASQPPVKARRTNLNTQPASTFNTTPTHPPINNSASTTQQKQHSPSGLPPPETHCVGQGRAPTLGTDQLGRGYNVQPHSTSTTGPTSTTQPTRASKPHKSRAAPNQLQQQLQKVAKRIHTNNSLTINITTPTQKDLYLIKQEAPFHITRKDHIARTSTPLGPWTFDDLITFVNTNHPFLDNKQIQQLTAKFVLFTQPAPSDHQYKTLCTLLQSS